MIARAGRRGMTLPEMLIVVAVFSLFLVLLVEFHSSGFRTLESDARKMSATHTTHVVGEVLHKELFDSRWAWVAPLASVEGDGPQADGTPAATTRSRPVLPAEASRGLGGSPLLYAGYRQGSQCKEFFFDGEKRRLVVAASPQPWSLDDVRFYRTGAHVVKYVVRADEHHPNTKLPSHRERSTLVGAVHMQPEAEEDWFQSVAWEDEHDWCVRGRVIHYGVTDPKR